MVHPAQPAPTPVSSAPASASTQTLDSQVSTFEQAVRSNAAAGKKVPVTIAVSQDQLAARINQALTSGEVQMPVSNVQVTIIPGQVIVKGQALAGPVTAPFNMTAVPQITDGKPVLQLQSLDFGAFPVPQQVRDRITAVVGSTDLLGDLPLTVTSFRAEQSRLVLEGVTRPATG